MRGLAIALMRCGARVSGSDRSESSALERLRLGGARVSIGQSQGNLPHRLSKARRFPTHILRTHLVEACRHVCIHYSIGHVPHPFTMLH